MMGDFNDSRKMQLLDAVAHTTEPVFYEEKPRGTLVEGENWHVNKDQYYKYGVFFPLMMAFGCNLYFRITSGVKGACRAAILTVKPVDITMLSMSNVKVRNVRVYSNFFWTFQFDLNLDVIHEFSKKTKTKKKTLVRQNNLGFILLQWAVKHTVCWQVWLVASLKVFSHAEQTKCSTKWAKRSPESWERGGKPHSSISETPPSISSIRLFITAFPFLQLLTSCPLRIHWCPFTSTFLFAAIPLKYTIFRFKFFTAVEQWRLNIQWTNTN